MAAQLLPSSVSAQEAANAVVRWRKPNLSNTKPTTATFDGWTPHRPAGSGKRAADSGTNGLAKSPIDRRGSSLGDDRIPTANIRANGGQQSKPSPFRTVSSRSSAPPQVMKLSGFVKTSPQRGVSAENGNVRRPKDQQTSIRQAMVRRAIHSGENPIDDPFNLRRPQNTGPAIQPASLQQPATIQQPATQVAPPAVMESPQTAQPKRIPNHLPLTPARSNQEDDLSVAPPVPPQAAVQGNLPRRATYQDSVGQEQVQPKGTELQPLQTEQPKSKYADCKRIYNHRNCCEVEGECKKAQKMVSSYPISRISLNITPSIRPSAKDAAEEIEWRTKTLDKVKTRAFKDKEGNLLAEGRMVNMRYENVWVEQMDGEIVKIPLNKLGTDETCYVTGWWGIPTGCELAPSTAPPRNPHPITMTWTASAVCNKPLYFEEPSLERYGHTSGPFTQPILSGAHFVLNIASLPYQMGINPPQECRYPLGHYRPGDCAPWLVRPIPLSLRGAASQAAAVTTGINIFP